MDNQIELLWRFSQEQQAVARYHDEERSKLTQYLLVVAAAAVGIAKIGQASLFANVVLGVFVLLTGCVGLLLVRQQSRECKGSANCANVYRAQIRKLYPDLPADDHAPQYTGRRAWLALHLLIALLGVAVIICAFIHRAAGGVP
jgi:hypothetical protein